MSRPSRTPLDDPTAERTADAIGGSNLDEQEEIVRRTPEKHDTTPRRYEQPVDEDPAVPSNDSSVSTKI